MQNEDGVLLFLSSDVVDVFTGKGWDNWSRFAIKRVHGKVYPNKIAGASLTHDQFKQLCNDLS